MSPRIASPLVTTRAPTFFARNQSAAVLTLASGIIFTTSVPFCLKMLSTVIASDLLCCPPTSITRLQDQRAPPSRIGNVHWVGRDVKQRIVSSSQSDVRRERTGSSIDDRALCAKSLVTATIGGFR